MSTQELTDLQEQKANFEAQLRGLTPDTEEYRAVQDEINIVTNKIAEKQFAAAQLEEKVQADDVPFVISGVDLSKATPELIDFVEKVVKADRRRIYAEHAVELEQAEIVAAQTNGALDILQKKYNELKEDSDQNSRNIVEFQQRVMILTTERDEALKLRDNAAAQLTEKDAEIAQLKSQIDDYQKAKVFGEREAQNIIETEPEEAAEINDALQKLYVSFENYGSINKVNKPDGTFELVKTDDLQKDWTPIEIPSVGGSNAADTFQGNTEAQPENPGDDSPTPPTVVGDTFRTGETDVDTMGGDSSNGSVVGQANVEARIQALEARVAKLESAA